MPTEEEVRRVDCPQCAATGSYIDDGVVVVCHRCTGDGWIHR